MHSRTIMVSGFSQVMIIY